MVNLVVHLRSPVGRATLHLQVVQLPTLLRQRPLHGVDVVQHRPHAREGAHVVRQQVERVPLGPTVRGRRALHRERPREGGDARQRLRQRRVCLLLDGRQVLEACSDLAKVVHHLAVHSEETLQLLPRRPHILLHLLQVRVQACVALGHHLLPGRARHLRLQRLEQPLVRAVHLALRVAHEALRRVRRLPLRLRHRRKVLQRLAQLQHDSRGRVVAVSRQHRRHGRVRGQQRVVQHAALGALLHEDLERRRGSAALRRQTRHDAALQTIDEDAAQQAKVVPPPLGAHCARVSAACGRASTRRLVHRAERDDVEVLRVLVRAYISFAYAEDRLAAPLRNVVAGVSQLDGGAGCCSDVDVGVADNIAVEQIAIGRSLSKIGHAGTFDLHCSNEVQIL
eukprot:Rhum_TRINITY_DN1182_c0_g1::Rhum_TRINITY_DN1182_c0_g1_i1::g.3646::m.3646